MASREKPDTANGCLADNMYQLHCSGAFEALGVRMDRSDELQRKQIELTAELKGIVRNGLKSRVDAIDRRMWAVAGATVLELVGIIVILVTQ